MKITLLAWSLPLALLLYGAPSVWSDDDERDEHEGRRHERSRGEEREHVGTEQRTAPGAASLKPATNPVYTDTCASCHFAYPPELLPARSWTRLMSTLGEHFGEAVELDAKDRDIITAYLQANAADHSRAKRAVKILGSIGNGTPLRITETPYIRGKHNEIRPAVVKRKAIGSLSNCTACHQHAAQGVFEEDDVRIPGG